MHWEGGAQGGILNEGMVHMGGMMQGVCVAQWFCDHSMGVCFTGVCVENILEFLL